MEKQRRSHLVFGLLLIIIGGFWLASQVNPQLAFWLRQFTWPMGIVCAGGLLILVGLLSGAPDLAIPGSIISGIGAILYYQNMTGDWVSWAYMWTLIPGFAGFGMILAGLISTNRGRFVRQGLRQVLTSLVIFAIFASLLGGFRPLGQYWPVLIIAAGVFLLVDALIQKRN